VTQLLIVRECIAQFSGNEFVIAIILFNWLILGGIGNRLAHIINQRFLPASMPRLAWIAILLAGFPVIQVFLIRFLRDIIFIPGSSTGFYHVFFFIFLTMSFYGLIAGVALPYSLFVLGQDNLMHPGTMVYITDNIGNVAGGILFSFVFIYLATPFQTILIVNIFLLIAAYCLLPSPYRRTSWIYIFLFLALSVLVMGVLLEKYSLNKGRENLVYYKESRYGRIIVDKNKELYTLFEDGNPVISSEDIALSEEAVHYPLAQVQNPKNIMLICAQSQMITEIEKYKPKSVDYFEINPDITAVLFKFAIIKDLPGLVKVIHKDAISFMVKNDKVYDAIIVNLADPTTFQANRFFTDRFFSLAKSRLGKDGILSFSTEGFDNYLSEPSRQKISSLFNTASQYFKHVVLLPGQRIFFLCSDNQPDADIPLLLKNKGIRTIYIADYFYGNLTGERISGLNKIIDKTTPKNRDMSPHVIKLIFAEWFEKYSASPKAFAIALFILCLVYFISIRSEEFVLFSTGCFAMGGEILTIFAVQILFGYIYSQVGLIVTAFLIGLFPGAIVGSRWRNSKKSLLKLTDFMLIILMIIFMTILNSDALHLHFVYFMIFGALVSFACGIQFPVVLGIMGSSRLAASRSFSADLLGAAFGTLLTSVVLIPGVGLLWAACGLIAIKCISLIFIQISHEKFKQA
jgi:spermidine synthase